MSMTIWRSWILMCPMINHDSRSFLPLSFALPLFDNPTAPVWRHHEISLSKSK